MPTFDYRCKHCGYEKEIISHKTIDEPMCPECEQKMQKMMPAPGLLKTNFHDKPSVKSR